jgi:hypothetical protein
MEEDPKIANRDYRLQAVTTLAEDFTSPFTGVTHKVGAEVVATGSVKYDKAHTLRFSLPNMTALFLNQSYIAWAESQILLQEEQFLASPSKFMPAGTLRPKNDTIFFNLLEQRMVAIVFAYTALESFANESIPDGYVFRKEREDKKCIEEYTKDQAEVLSLDTKLHDVLPPIYNIKSPKGTHTWTRYNLIKKLRDRIIHLKSKDRISTMNPHEQTIWKELLNKSNPNVALEAKEIVGYYLKNVPEKPRWFTKFLHKV